MELSFQTASLVDVWFMEMKSWEEPQQKRDRCIHNEIHNAWKLSAPFVENSEKNKEFLSPGRFEILAHFADAPLWTRLDGIGGKDISAAAAK